MLVDYRLAGCREAAVGSGGQTVGFFFNKFDDATFRNRVRRAGPVAFATRLGSADPFLALPSRITRCCLIRVRIEPTNQGAHYGQWARVLRRVVAVLRLVAVLSGQAPPS